MQEVNINKIKPNPANPRTVKDYRFKQLVTSLQEFPEMLQKRPLVCISNEDGTFTVLGGNMRLKAAKEIGLKTLPVMLADDWSEAQRKEFVIKDNIGYGDWDWDILKIEWDETKLIEWCLELPDEQMPFNGNYSDKNKEIDVNDFDNEMIIKLKYTEEEYFQVKEQLTKIAPTPEQAVWKLLGNE